MLAKTYVRLTRIIVLLLLIASIMAPVRLAAGETATLLDSADYTFAYPDPSGNGGLPDPAVWTIQTSWRDYPVVQRPIEGLGLGMSDPDHSAYFLYVHTTASLSGDPNDPNFQNTATFRVRAQVPYISDGSGAWSAEAIGWRMVMDDGSRRLELALARSPSHVRQVRVENSTSIPAMDFPWDNDLPNTYEITRLANGAFVVTLTNGDPSNPYPVVSQTIAPGLIPTSPGLPQVAWGTGREGGGAFYWQEAHAEVHGPAVNDTTPPVITVPAAVAVSATSPAGASVSFSVTVTDDRDPNPVVSCTPISGSTFAIGTTTVRCMATDASGNSSSTSFPVTVRGAADQLGDLITLVQNLNLSQGIANSLDAKLQNALDALDAARAGSLAAACNKLDSFVKEVQAQAGNGTLTPSQAEELISTANQIKAVLGCP